MLHANNKGTDQQAHPGSLISTFVIRYLESIVVKHAPCKISMIQLVSVALDAGLRHILFRTLEERFSHIRANMILTLSGILNFSIIPDSLNMHIVDCKVSSSVNTRSLNS